MPPLTKQNKKKEADFGVYFRAWVAKNPLPFGCALELKQTATESIPFSSVEAKQIAYGMSIKSDKGALIRVQGLSGEPDYIWCRNMPSYIVIKFVKGFTVIDTETFVLERDRSKRKSLTWDRAKDISVKTVNF